jgi:hypothetical protein
MLTLQICGLVPIHTPFGSHMLLILHIARVLVCPQNLTGHPKQKLSEFDL